MYSPTIDLTTLVGFRQNPDPTGKALNRLTDSTSGMYFNDVHPLLTINNLAAIADQDFTYPTWASGVYAVGDRVTFNAKTFECIEATTTEATTDTDHWEEIDQFTEWLAARVDAGVKTALTRWCTERVIFNNARAVINAGVFPQITKENNAIIGGNWMGLEIYPMGKGRALTVHKIGLHFASNTTVDVKVFRQSQSAPVYEKSIVYNSAGSVQWETFEVQMTKPELYYIVYDADGKDPVDSMSYFECAFGIRGVDTGSDVAGVMWDVNDNAYSHTSNYGLFVEATYGCDLTDFILSNKQHFARLIQLQVGSNLLREIAMNPNARVNRLESAPNTQTILYEIDGDSQGRPGGVKRELERTIKSMRLDMSGIDKRCLGCHKGVKYGAV